MSKHRNFRRIYLHYLIGLGSGSVVKKVNIFANSSCGCYYYYYYYY